MRPVVTIGVAWSLSQSVVIASTAKTAELIEMSFGSWSVVGPSNHVLDNLEVQWNCPRVSAMQPCVKFL